MSATRDKDEALALIGAWLDSAAATDSADRKLTIEKTRYLKGSTGIVGTVFTITAEIRIGDVKIPLEPKNILVPPSGLIQPH